MVAQASKSNPSPFREVPADREITEQGIFTKEQGICMREQRIGTRYSASIRTGKRLVKASG